MRETYWNPHKFVQCSKVQDVCSSVRRRRVRRSYALTVASTRRSRMRGAGQPITQVAIRWYVRDRS